MKATKDLCMRVLEEVQFLEQRQEQADYAKEQQGKQKKTEDREEL